MKGKSIVAVVAGLLCVALSVFGMLKAVNGSIFGFPIVKVFLDDAELESFSEEMEEAVEEAENASEEELDEFEDEFGLSFKEAKSFLKRPSINGMIKITKKAKFDIDQDAVLGLSIIRTCIIVYALFIVLFSLLGVLFKKMVFPIIAIIFSLGFYLVFVGVIWLVLFIALSITQAVLFKKEKKIEA